MALLPKRSVLTIFNAHDLVNPKSMPTFAPTKQVKPKQQKIMAFKPKKSSDSKQMYKQHLLNGDVLKIDGGAYDQIDLIPRSMVNDWHARENVGRGDFEQLPRHTNEFYAAVNELNDEGYVVKKVSCEYSGCCQYHAVRYYLAGEDD